MRRLVLCRHGQTLHNSERRFTGWYDSPLTSVGRRESSALARRLRDEPIDVAYSSDLQRALETAHCVLRFHPDADLVQDPGLREANFGAWQGLTFDEAQKAHPGEFTTLLKRRADFRPPGGETILEVRQRVVAVYERTRVRHEGQTVLFVASGGPLQILLTAIFGMPVDAHWRLGMGNCSVSVVDFVDGEPLLALLNDRSHIGHRDTFLQTS
jgi:broad specificity phosphatase PhoE